jgi:ribosomal protein S18 acetylase RimI-like enzyme
MYNVRRSTPNDREEIKNLYKSVNGLARNSSEVTDEYIDNFTTKSQIQGLQLVIVDSSDSNKIVAEVHCYKTGIKVFEHILGDLTIAVDPNHQGRGLGQMIFKALLDIVTNDYRDILRIELIARESNIKAINLYLKLGFVIEGRLENRIKTGDNIFEADIPMAWFNNNFKES